MELGLSVTAYIVLALTLLYILKFLHTVTWKSGNGKHFPPGPPGLPLIGNIHQLNLMKPHFTYLELAKKYGMVFSFQKGTKKIVIITGYEAVKDALINHAEEFGERGKTRIFQDMDKDLGLVHTRGENWKVMRRFTLTTLRDFGMGKSSIEAKIVEECDYLIKQFASFKGKPFDTTLLMNASVANVIVSILLGDRMDFEDPQFKRLLNLMNENVRLLGSKMVESAEKLFQTEDEIDLLGEELEEKVNWIWNYIRPLAFLYVKEHHGEIIGLYNAFPFLGVLPGNHKTIRKNVEEFCDFVTKTFMKYLKNLDENDQRSFIDAYLLRQKEEAGTSHSYFHNGNLTRLVRNLFSAGMETTSTTLRWGLLLMMKYPHIQEKVQEEIARVIGSAQPMYSLRLQMPYTNAVIHEIQRFADIVPLNVPHETTKDVMFRGYFIPKATYIIPLLSSVLRDKTQFEKAEEFYPNHFLDSKGNFLKKDAFMPFSAGRRVCAGENLARMELFIFFTSLLQKFTFHFPPGVSNMDLTLGPGFTNIPRQHDVCAMLRV